MGQNFLSGFRYKLGAFPSNRHLKFFFFDTNDNIVIDSYYLVIVCVNRRNI